MLNNYATRGMTADGSAALPGLPTRLTPVGGVAAPIYYTRNIDWLPMPSVVDTDVKAVALIRINAESNFSAMYGVGSLGYSVFWGDSNVSCTFQDSGDTVTAVAHGLVNTDKVMFNTVVTTTGISINTIYFVVNKTTDTFQVSLTSGGSALPLTTDGTGTINIPEKVATGVQSNHQYDYTTFDTTLQTAGYVTFTDSGDTVNKTAHGHVNGDQVIFYSITSTTGISINTNYYVVNATANTYQVSTTLGGSAAALTTDGSGTTLPYKQAIMTVVPQNTGTLTTFDCSRQHTQTLLSAYVSPILDLIISGSGLTTITLAGTITPKIMERCSILSSAVTSFASLFASCIGLKQVTNVISTGTVTSLASMFTSCSSLVEIGQLSVGSAVTNTTNMFFTCQSLTSVSLFNTQSVTNMTGMFSTCRKLTTVPLFNTQSVTTMNSMFQNCSMLTTVPLFNTVAVTDMTNMFSGCFSLTSVPLFNTVAVTLMDSMFSGCSVLPTVPLFNTVAVASMTTMFGTCTALTSVPLFNTVSVGNMNSMFLTCRKLTTVPLFDTSSVIDMGSMFSGCVNLTTVPLFNTAAVTSMASMFNGCSSLVVVPLFNTAAVTSMSTMFQNCQCLITIPLFVTTALLTMTNMFTSCVNLTTIPALNLATATSLPALANLTNLSSFYWTGATKNNNCSGCILSVTAINTALDNLGIGSANTITLTNNWGSQTAISTASVATVSGTKVLTMASTAGLVAGMEMTGTGIAGTAVSVTIQTAADTVTLTAHGIPNGTQMSFSTIVTSTGIAIKTIYYVINATANTFQIALTAGGSAINITGSDGTGTITYPNTIQSIVLNTSVTMNVNSSATGTVTATSTTIRRSSGSMKGWTVTT